MDDKKFPCPNCVALVVCMNNRPNIKKDGHAPWFRSWKYINYVNELVRDCETLRSYMLSGYMYEFRSARRQRIASFFERGYKYDE